MYQEKILSHGRNIQTPKRGVIHAMGEYILVNGSPVHAIDFLDSIGLSAHIFVCPNGDIIRCRYDTQGAYHAAGNNVDSVGAEFLVEGVHTYDSFVEAIKGPYLSDIQFESGCEFIKEKWVQKAGILRYDKHSTLSPERKVDPGDGFPWVEFLKQIGVIV